MRANTLMRSVAIVMTLASALSRGEEKEPSKDPLAGLNVTEHQPSPLEKAVGEANEKHLDAMEAVNAAYRKDLAAALAKATEIEIYLLDFEPEKVGDSAFHWEYDLPEDQFPIIPYKKASKILQRKKLAAEEIKLLMPSLQTTIRAHDASPGAACHFPIHGIRIRDGGNIVFQTSICYMCGNFYMAYPLVEGANWEGLSSPEFEKMMKELLPVPRKEIDRFEEKVMGKGKK